MFFWRIRGDNLRMQLDDQWMPKPRLRARCCPNMIRFCSIWRQRGIGWGMSTAMVRRPRLAGGSWNHKCMALFCKGLLVFHSVDPIFRVHVKQLSFMMVGSIGQTLRNEDHRSCQKLPPHAPKGPKVSCNQLSMEGHNDCISAWFDTKRCPTKYIHVFWNLIWKIIYTNHYTPTLYPHSPSVPALATGSLPRLGTESWDGSWPFLAEARGQATRAGWVSQIKPSTLRWTYTYHNYILYTSGGSKQQFTCAWCMSKICIRKGSGGFFIYIEIRNYIVNIENLFRLGTHPYIVNPWSQNIAWKYLEIYRWTKW